MAISLDKRSNEIAFSGSLMVLESVLFGFVVYIAITKRWREALVAAANDWRIWVLQRLGVPLKSPHFHIFPGNDKQHPQGQTRRFALAEVAGNPALAKDPWLWKRNIIPLNRNPLDPKVSGYTVMGISAKEIRDLGDFPDYTTLSGVPQGKAYEGFEPDKAVARPYRPFRWPYLQNMTLYKLDTDWFLEVTKEYTDTIAQRQRLYAEHGQDVLNHRPGSELACKELMEICLQFYCARYPRYFSLDREQMIFKNAILGTKTNLKTADPLQVLLNNVPEDFAIMLRDPKTGYHVLRAGVICSALGWNLNAKVDMTLDEIHGPIPDYKERMQKSMEKYFSAWRADKPIQRGSWGLEVGEPLYLPPGHPDEKLRERQDPNLTLDQCHLRVDWQTLRRLPLSGAVVFNYTALFTPVKEFADEPKIPSIVLKCLREGKENIMVYKGTHHVQHVVEGALEEMERQQIAKGLISAEWEVSTTQPQSFFEGWEEKWHRQQGF